jgi:hypothetical protein
MQPAQTRQPLPRSPKQPAPADSLVVTSVLPGTDLVNRAPNIGSLLKKTSEEKQPIPILPITCFATSRLGRLSNPGRNRFSRQNGDYNATLLPLYHLQMHFRVKCTVDDLTDKMCDEPIMYDLVRPSIANLSIYKQTPTTELPKGGPVFASCTTSLELDEREGFQDLVTAMARSKNGQWANFEGMSEKMNAIYEIIDPIFSSLRTHLKTSIAILKWRYGITGSPINSISNWSEAVSSDGSAWRGISPVRGLKISFSGVVKKIDASAVQEVIRLHNEGEEPPLSLQLLIEARNQRMTHPRSALVIGVTAAEIALKQLIGELAPDARWLAENVPSPPIARIARDYIPSLRVKAQLKGKALRPPKKLLKRLTDAVELRNKVVHAGEAPPDPEKLQEILAAVEDLVWICCLYTGHTWAWDHVSFDTKSTWEDQK